MSKLCTICTDPRVDQINAEIAEGVRSIRGLAIEFGVSKDALQRHANNHLMADSIDTETGDFNTVEEIKQLLAENKITLHASKNPVERTKLIGYQISLMDTLKEEQAKITTTKRKSAQQDVSKLNKEEVFVMIRMANKMLGLHNKDVIKDGWVTRDPDGVQSRPIPLSMLDEDE